MLPQTAPQQAGKSVLAPFSEAGLGPGTLPGPPQATEDSGQRGVERDSDLAGAQVAKWPQSELCCPRRRRHLLWLSPLNGSLCSLSGSPTPRLPHIVPTVCQVSLST